MRDLARTLAPDWDIAQWLNRRAPIALPQLRGKAVFAVAFQMLCPGCVSHGLPQATRVRQAFAPEDVAVIGLHTVFEHHEAQGGTAALSAFLHEYRIGFPVGIDRADPSGVPVTMRRYAMQGTPTTLLIDRAGRLRLQQLGHLDDLALGAAIARLLADETQTCTLDGGCA
jgi:hypothetical protein